jgi:hypothetical protein
MVPKPDNKWRFTVDFRGINSVSEREYWPIPNIKDMLRRIGDKKPKYFLVADLTSGYNQMPIAEECKIFTAFMCFFGLFQWLRLPMGLAGAASYFQRILCTIVLAGLIMIICELYIDDLIIPAETEDELITNFRTILMRFAQYKIKINPDKLRVGMEGIEVVGHTLDHTGIHFDRTRLDGILDIPLPTTQKGLKSFLGVCGWFRDQVKEYAHIARPLEHLTRNYVRGNLLKWTEEAKKAFDDLKREVNTYPQLFWMDDKCPYSLIQMHHYMDTEHIYTKS